MTSKITRRRALAGLSSTLMLPILGSARDDPRSSASRSFQHGVASGDPDHESLVIWTRVSGYERPVSVDWQVAEDSRFEQVVARGAVTASPARDYTVKAVVTALKPGSDYFYRFSVPNEDSPTGRTRTLPRGDIDTLTLAVVSCSNYPFGYFNAYEAIAKDPAVEWVLHLGDYIYEYGVDSYGGKTGKTLNRNHQPVWETVNLNDYRQRHAQYKADPQSQMMHARHPLLLLWDDHEVTNNPWIGGAQNHQPDSEGDWSARREAALQAYFEWMPVRDPLPGQQRIDYWRNWQFGTLASLISLETRHSGRARQVDYSDYADSVTDAASAQRFMQDIVGAPGRPMLSGAMESFFADALGKAKALNQPWKLVANQIPMARTLHPRMSPSLVASIEQGLSAEAANGLREFARKGKLGLPLYLDPWDGYPRAREDFYALCRSNGVQDLLVLTGDSHSFWSNQLFDDAGTGMGLELGTAGITSPGDFIQFGTERAALLDGALIASNPEIAWTDGQHNGYLRLTLDRGQALADYVAMDSILEQRVDNHLLRSVSILRDGASLRFGTPRKGL